MKTAATKKNQVKRGWHLIDARGKVLGRLASEIAQLLQGKEKPDFAPYLDSGDQVVVINAAQVEVTGKKRNQKIYYRHSGFPGGLKSETFAQLIKRNPAEVVSRAVSGMLPKNKLREKRMTRLRVFPGSEHKYQDRFQGTEKQKD